jgi:hypothetical protein
VAARKRALLKKVTWEEFFAKNGEKNAKPYEFRETYRENAIVFHPKFGKGFISEVVSESKVEITFADARRILVHNRKDIPGSPVGREDDGLPSTTPAPKVTGKAAKAAEKAAAKAVAAVAKSVPAKPAAPAKPVAAKPEAKKLDEKKHEEKKLEEKKPAKTTPKKAEVKAEVKKSPAKKPEAKKPAAKKVAVKKVPAKPAAKKPAKPAKKKHK